MKTKTININQAIDLMYPPTLTNIAEITKVYSHAHEHLAGIVQDMQADMDKVKSKYDGALRDAIASTATAKLSLHTALTLTPELFKSPRTQIFHGVKVGFQKGKGVIAFDDADKVVALLRKNFGDNAIAYISTVETPDKKMLQDMPVSELKKVGCELVGTGDKVVIKHIDGEVEKMVAALLKDAVESEAA